jgi:pantoate--beta-alanine ligase
MHTIPDPREFQSLCWSWRAQGLRVALVPTMGYLHQGHISLIEWARANADKVAVTLFVNPAQFGPGEDLDRYPADPEGDAAKAARAGADVLFAPPRQAMYPEGFATTVRVAGLTAGLCGRSRPGHFDGVATVVTKLFLLAMPALAVFGQKDWQQLAMLRRLALDLDFPVEVVGRPIVREPDGLALSSRNVNLTPSERSQAPAIHQGLNLARQWMREEPSPQALTDRLARFYAQTVPAGTVDYVECVHPDTMEPVQNLEGPALLAVAVQFTRARLIDNILLNGWEKIASGV